MYIEKKQIQINNFRDQIIYFPRARDAMKAFLARYNTDEYCVFLPGFIGFSPNEGSGLYDPIVELGIRHQFYLMTEELKVDLDDLNARLEQCPKKKILILVHYWGYVDPQYEQIVACARKNQCTIMEDMAHAVYTEYVDHRCGYLGDASFYSLHKMFPLERGGMLKIRTPELFDTSLESDCSVFFPVEYDMYSIARKRKENAAHWETLLSRHPDLFKILRPVNEYTETTPQTYPVAVQNVDRYKLYLAVNECGYGLISLYHTLIEPLRTPENEKALSLSGCILNFPVHPDVTGPQIEDMYREVMNACEKLKA